jgi:hypothetical protein
MGETFEQLKQRSRANLHSVIGRAALYLIDNPDYVSPTDTPTEPAYLITPCTVRLHTSFNAIGDAKGTNFHYAERAEIDPTMIFLVAEIAAPQRNAIVSFVTGEAYRVDHVEPRDGITIKCAALRLSAAEAAGLPTPTLE